MRNGAGGKRRDASEAGIVQVLRALGATVIHLSGAAPVPDLLVGYRGRWFALEVKSGEKAGFTRRQAAAMTNGEMAAVVVRSVEDALIAIGAGKVRL